MSEDTGATFAEAEEFAPEQPRPLLRKMPPAEPYPVDALGPVLSRASRALQHTIQAPDAVCAHSVLGAATLSVQGHANVVLPSGQVRPISEYFVTVAPTGDRKTASDEAALKPVRHREKALAEGFGSQHLLYQNELDVWESERTTIRRAKGSRSEKVRKLGALGPRPVAPSVPMLTCPEPTFEGLVRLLREGLPSVGVFSDEGGQFLGGHAMNAENRLKTASALSSLWDGSDVRRVRQGEGSFVLRGRRVALSLMIQPVLMPELLGDSLLANQGLLSRMLIAYPESLAGSRRFRASDRESEKALTDCDAVLKEALQRPMNTSAEDQRELRPRELHLSSDARELWIAFHDHVERLLAPGGPLESIRGLANKLPEHAARVAVVPALLEDLETTELSSDHMEAGIVRAEFYASEALRLSQISKTSATLLRAQAVLDWLQKSWGEPLISLPDLYQFGPNSIRDATTARECMRVLDQHGWVFPLTGGEVVRGTKRSEVWRIVQGNIS